MLKYLIEKEFKQIRRNSFLPRLIIAMPLMMMLVFPWAANQEVKDIKLSVVDNDHSTVSERLVHKVASSGYFQLSDVSSRHEEAMNSIRQGTADIILEIEDGFEKHLYTDGAAQVSLEANSVNGTRGTLGSSYLSSILSDFAGELRKEEGAVASVSPIPHFSINTRYRFNPHLDYKVFMVPALMVMLLTMMCGFLPALNIVGEKETGTIEQMNVTPVSRLSFVLSKLIPYWVIGFAVLTLSITLAYLVYGLFPAGSLLTIYLFASIYILVVSGIGLIVSNYSDTMQQAMFVMFFFMMILLLMSGLFTPINSMPEWAQAITVVNPLKYFIQAMRAVYLKGSTFGNLTTQFFALCGFALALNTWAVISYKKKS